MRGNAEAGRRAAAYGNVEAQAKTKRDKILEAFAVQDKAPDDGTSALLSEHAALSRIHQAILLGGPQAEQALKAAGYDNKMTAGAIQAEIDRTEKEINTRAGDVIYATQRADNKMRDIRMREMQAASEDAVFNREKKNREEANAAILSNMSHDDISRLHQGKMAIPDGMTQRDVLNYFSSPEGSNRASRAMIVAGALSPQVLPGVSGAQQAQNTAMAMAQLTVESMPINNLKREIEANKRDYAANWAETARQAAIGGVTQNELPPEISEYKIKGQYYPATMIDEIVRNKDKQATSLVAQQHLDETNAMAINNQMRKTSDAFSRISSGDQLLQQSLSGEFLVMQERYARLVKLKPSESSGLLQQFNKDTNALLEEAVQRKMAGMNLPPDQSAYLKDYLLTGYMNPKDQRHKALVSTAGVHGLVTSGEPMHREFGLYLNAAGEQARDREFNDWRASVEFKRDPNATEAANINGRAQEKTYTKAQSQYARSMQQGIFDEFIDIARVGHEEAIDKRTGVQLTPEAQQKASRLYLYLQEIKNPASDIGKGIYEEVQTTDGKKKLQLNEDMLMTKLVVLDAALARKGFPAHLADDYIGLREDFKYLNKRYPIPQDPSSQMLMSSVLNAGQPQWAATSPDLAQLRLLEANAKTAKTDLQYIKQRVLTPEYMSQIGLGEGFGNPIGMSNLTPLDNEVLRLGASASIRGSIGGASETKRIETLLGLQKGTREERAAKAATKEKPVNPFDTERARIQSIVKNGMPASSE